jgi:hypothetical protein
MSPVVTLVFGLLIMWAAATGRLEQIWQALRKGK